MSIWVDSKAIRNKEVFGIFRKYTYYNIGHPSYVYCTSEKDFLRLLNMRRLYD